MNQPLAFSLIIVQALICWLLLRPIEPSTRARTVWERYANPASVFGAFYAVFFLLPQVYGAFADFHIISYEDTSVPLRFEVFLQAQIWSTLFVASVLVGSTAASVRRRRGSHPHSNRGSRFNLESTFDLSGYQHLALRIYFLVGIAAYVLLAREFASINGFRSELVKTPRGQALTALGFVANYAVAVYAARLLFRRRYIQAILLILPFSLAVLATGSRGRILWPLLIALVVANGFKPGFSRAAKTVAVSLGTLALLIFDPISAVLRGEQEVDVLAGLDLSRLFEKRNFDGFANFARIVNDSQAQPDVDVLFQGARGTFMNEFFPEIFASGVGFGATIPGWFALAVGLPGMLVLGGAYGLSLGFLQHLHARAESVAARAAFLFFLSWYAAVGGNFVESLDKLVAAVVPGVVVLALATLAQRRHQYPVITHTPNPDMPSRTLTGVVTK